MKCVKHETFAVQVSKTSLSNISKAKNKTRAMACRKVSVSLRTVSRCTATWLCTQSNFGISCFPCVTSYKWLLLSHLFTTGMYFHLVLHMGHPRTSSQLMIWKVTSEWMWDGGTQLIILSINFGDQPSILKSLFIYAFSGNLQLTYRWTQQKITTSIFARIDKKA